jgi:hypothetical protein
VMIHPLKEKVWYISVRDFIYHNPEFLKSSLIQIRIWFCYYEKCCNYLTMYHIALFVHYITGQGAFFMWWYWFYLNTPVPSPSHSVCPLFTESLGAVDLVQYRLDRRRRLSFILLNWQAQLSWWNRSDSKHWANKIHNVII